MLRSARSGFRRLAGTGRRLLQEKGRPVVESPAPSVPATGLKEVKGTAEAPGNLATRQFGVPGRYAAALFNAARNAGKEDAVQGDLRQLADAMGGNADFRNFMADPSVPRGEKLKGLEAVLSRMEVTDLTKNFVALLAENNRLTELERIIEKLHGIMAEERGEVTATVTTAEPLDEETRDMIKNDLQASLSSGQTLVLQEEVNPALIGGVIIDMFDKHVDMSILSRVRQLQRIVREAV